MPVERTEPVQANDALPHEARAFNRGVSVVILKWMTSAIERETLALSYLAGVVPLVQIDCMMFGSIPFQLLIDLFYAG